MPASEMVSCGILMILCLAGVSTAQSLDDRGQEDIQGVLRAADAPLESDSNNNEWEEEAPPVNADCGCAGLTCSCCQRIRVQKIRLNENCCLGLTYLQQEIGIRVTLKLGSKTLFSQKVSISNPPPICAGVPYLASAASVCIQLNRLSAGKGFVRGCASFVAKILNKSVANFPLGCFTIRFLEDIPETGVMGMASSYDGSHWIRTQQEPSLSGFEDNVVAVKMEEFSKKRDSN